MVSSSTKLALNKQTLSKKFFSTHRNEIFEKKIRPHYQEKLFPLLGVEKIEENFKNYIHQQKKAPNKFTKSLIDPKSVSTSQNEGFLEKCDSTATKSYFHSNQYLKKIEENGFLQQN